MTEETKLNDRLASYRIESLDDNGQMQIHQGQAEQLLHMTEVDPRSSYAIVMLGSRQFFFECTLLLLDKIMSDPEQKSQFMLYAALRQKLTTSTFEDLTS